MDEFLAIKPDLILIWDEAWFRFARFSPYLQLRTAVGAAADIEMWLHDPTSVEAYDQQCVEPGNDPIDAALLETRLVPDPRKVRLRVYQTSSTHKSLSALQQGSMVLVKDVDYHDVEEQLHKAVFTHAPTSSSQQLIASLDVARRQMELEGFGLVMNDIEIALVIRRQLNGHPLISKYFHVFGADGIIPAEYRQRGRVDYLAPGANSASAQDNMRDDEFRLDPTVKSLMTDIPDLPNSSCFHDALRGDASTGTPEGDIRGGFYAAYNADGCEHIWLNDEEIDHRLGDGPPLVSANFVIPYPPRFPIMVPGLMLTPDRFQAHARFDGEPRLQRIGRTEAGSSGTPGNTLNNRSALNMLNWFTTTLRSYPEVAVFLSLGIGYYVGGFSYRGFSLGAVTSTLLAAILIGQLGITVSPNVKAIFFLMFLFAVGYGVGPQFVRGIAADGLPQAFFAALVCVFCLAAPVIVAKLAGYDLGYAAGLYAGSQTISASMGLATDAINRLETPPDQTRDLLNSMPIAYAVTYIFGTVGSAILLAQIGPKLLGIDLVAACKAYEARSGGAADTGGATSAWHRFELRAFRVAEGGQAVGITAAQAESLVTGARLFIERIRREGKIEDATAETILREGDIVAVAGPRDVLVEVLGQAAREVEDAELLHVPVEGVDAYVTNKAVDGKTLAELATMPGARGVFLRRIVRGAVATVIPILPNTQVQRGDILTIVGREQDTAAAIKMLGVADRPTDVADVAFIGGAITLGALIGALVLRVGGVPLTLSTAGGALLAGLFFGWLRSVRPTFGRIPSSTIWFMNSVGLNIFIAVVGISAGPGFVAGLQKLGISLFLWGIVASSVPLILAMYAGKYLFRFDPAILLGCCAGARTTTAAIGMICDNAKSQVPALGYTVTYAVGNTLLTIWGMVIVMLLS